MALMMSCLVILVFLGKGSAGCQGLITLPNWG
jgi:hypothetical protein